MKRERKRRFETSLSLSLHVYLSSPPLYFFLALTIGQYILFENACELQRVVFNVEGCVCGCVCTCTRV